jgi:hypothetical protein
MAATSASGASCAIRVPDSFESHRGDLARGYLAEGLLGERGADGADGEDGDGQRLHFGQGPGLAVVGEDRAVEAFGAASTSFPCSR